MLLEEFFHQHANENLEPKTVERYREQVKYVSEELLAKPIGEITRCTLLVNGQGSQGPAVTLARLKPRAH